ncbi:hypothetical protein QBC35DRAFT_510183 [Podospora australis]|uniref:Uncharacterized protein n=1 Tax=Podospora australis TaxID=1536484 RepID=A0AAN7ADA7_9PEZI|nr:hypothetical protein QBC35DRAFT_510183 [Podospora australis]
MDRDNFVDTRARFLEVIIHEDGTSDSMTGGVGTDHLIDWLANPFYGRQTMIFRLLYFSMHQHPFQLGMPREVWHSISETLGLHPSTEQAVLDNNGNFAVYPSKNLAGELEQIKLVMKVPNKVHVGFDALSLSHDSCSRTVSAMVHGMDEHDWPDLLKQVTENPHLALLPTFLPSVLFAIHHLRVLQYRAFLDDKIFTTEIQTGYGIAGRAPAELELLEEFQPPPRISPTVTGHSRDRATRSKSWMYRLKQRDQPQAAFFPHSYQPVPHRDFETYLKRLHLFHPELACLSVVMRFCQEYGQFLVKLTTEQMERVSAADSKMAMHYEEVLHLLQLPCSQSFTALSQLQSLKDRVQSQTTLIFSLISQDENRISRLVAEDSARIAAAAKRDSAAMKAIAFVTMLFLPATFVAAFLSMPFVDWNDGGTPAGDNESNSPTKTTPLVWIYWAITGPLTVSLLVGWRIWWKYEARSADEEGERASRESKARLDGTRTFSSVSDDAEGKKDV